jgi:hypothetical protein
MYIKNKNKKQNKQTNSQRERQKTNSFTEFEISSLPENM